MKPSILPMLATAGTSVPVNEGWAFEPKYDGIRVIAVASTDQVQLLSRNGIDKALQFPEVVESLRAFARRRRFAIVLDGELVGVKGDVLGRFQSMQALFGSPAVARAAGGTRACVPRTSAMRPRGARIASAR